MPRSWCALVAPVSRRARSRAAGGRRPGSASPRRAAASASRGGAVGLRPQQVADRLRPAGIALARDPGIDDAGRILVDAEGDALHGPRWPGVGRSAAGNAARRFASASMSGVKICPKGMRGEPCVTDSAAGLGGRPASDRNRRGLAGPAAPSRAGGGTADAARHRQRGTPRRGQRDRGAARRARRPPDRPHRRGAGGGARPDRHPAQRRGQGQPVLPARLQPRPRHRPRHHGRRHAGQHAHPRATARATPTSTS